MLTFILAIINLLVTPGPGVLTTAGVGAAFGFRAGITYVTGLFIGTNLVALAVASGLAAIIIGVPAIRTVLLIASVGYLIYLAAKIAFSGSKIAFIEAVRAPGIRDGIALQMVNPKAYVVNMTLFSGFGFMPDNLLIETVLKFMIINSIWIPVHIIWLWAGVSLHRLDLAPRMQRAINMFMAVAMLAVVGLALWSG